MAKNIYRRCSCRGEDGKQLGASCPKLKSNPRHGTWAYQGSAGVDAEGNRRRIRKSGFATREDAERAFSEVKRRLRRGSYSFEKITVSEWAERWYKRGVADGWARKTADGYRRYLDNDIIPAFGKTVLDELRRRDISEWVDDQIEDGRGKTAINRCHACLRSMLSSAEQRDLIESNPASKIVLPKVDGEGVKVWSSATVDKFLRSEQAVDEHEQLVDRLAPLWTLALGTGMRRGELVGLRWEDVDLATREIVVNVQLVEVDGVHETAVKTAAGRGRVIPIVEPIVDALLARRQQAKNDRQSLEGAGLEWLDTGRVFGREDGSEVRPEHTTKAFTRRVQELNLPPLTLHGLRHTFASVALGSGQSMAVVSKLMGHASVGITVDLYSHLATDRAREAMRGIDAVLQAACKNGLTSGLTSHESDKKKAPTVMVEASARP